MKRYTFFVCSIKFQFYFLSDLPPPSFPSSKSLGLPFLSFSPLHYITIGLISIEFFFSSDSTENLVLKFMPHLINLSLHTSLEPNIIISVSVHYPSHLILFFSFFPLSQYYCSPSKNT